MRPARAALPAALALLPRAADACTVCLSGRDDDTARAFLVGSLVLSALPLAIVGGIAWWIRRRAHAVEGRESEAGASTPPSR